MKILYFNFVLLSMSFKSSLKLSFITSVKSPKKIEIQIPIKSTNGAGTRFFSYESTVKKKRLKKINCPMF